MRQNPRALNCDDIEVTDSFTFLVSAVHDWAISRWTAQAAGAMNSVDMST